MSQSPKAAVPARILVVEDERDIAALVGYHLMREGHRVRTAETGPEALHAAAAERPDLVLLDLMLPGLSGYDVLKALRGDERTAAVPVIVLTARRDEADRVRGLELGADDYVTKPFSPRELTLRVAAVLRRAQAPPVTSGGRTLEAGEVLVDVSAKRVYVAGEPVELTRTEYRLLESLLEGRGRVQTRQQLLETAWGIHARIETRTVDMHVQRLRTKLGEAGAMIETVRGFGYRLRAENA